MWHFSLKFIRRRRQSSFAPELSTKPQFFILNIYILYISRIIFFLFLASLN